MEVINFAKVIHLGHFINPHLRVLVLCFMSCNLLYLPIGDRAISCVVRKSSFCKLIDISFVALLSVCTRSRIKSTPKAM